MIGEKMLLHFLLTLMFIGIEVEGQLSKILMKTVDAWLKFRRCSKFSNKFINPGICIP
jgi:hypothetical protein